MPPTIDPAAVRETCQSLSDFAAEEYQRGVLDERARLLPACKLARAELAFLKEQTKARNGGSVDRALKACIEAIRKAEATQCSK